MGYSRFKQKNLAGRGSRLKRDQTTALTPLLHRLSRSRSRELVAPSKDRSTKFCFTELIVHVRGVRHQRLEFSIGAVREHSQPPRRGLLRLALGLPAFAELGLIDEYEFIVHPRLAGHGPTLFAGLSKFIDLKLVGRQAFRSGAVSMRYEPVSSQV